MAECDELETLVYCLGPVGGEENNVVTEGSAFSSKEDYTKKGYARYIAEARNIIIFQRHVMDYFMKNVETESEEDPLAFIDAVAEEELKASIHKMKKHWKEMFTDHQRELREVLKNPKETLAIEDFSEGSDSSSSAKIRRLDAEASSEAIPKDSKPDEASKKNPKPDAPVAKTVGVPAEEVRYPRSVFIEMLKDFHQLLKKDFHEMISKFGKAYERISTKESEVHDIKGFTYLKMGKFAKWKYTLKTLDLLVMDLEKKFEELDLDFHEKKKNEKRLTDWMYFDDGKRDRKYHHRILIPMDLTGPVEEVSAVAHQQLKRYLKLTQSLEVKLPVEYEVFCEKAEGFKKILSTMHGPIKQKVQTQASTDSGDTLFNIADMPEES